MAKKQLNLDLKYNLVSDKKWGKKRALLGGGTENLLLEECVCVSVCAWNLIKLPSYNPLIFFFFFGLF